MIRSVFCPVTHRLLVMVLNLMFLCVRPGGPCCRRWWWWACGIGGEQQEQTSPCFLCPSSGSSRIKQEKWDTTSQGGQVG